MTNARNRFAHFIHLKEQSPDAGRHHGDAKLDPVDFVSVCQSQMLHVWYIYLH